MSNTLTIRNKENATLMANIRVKRFLENFDQKWNEPNDKTAVAVVWSTLSDADRAKVRTSDPTLYNDMEAKYAIPTSS